MEAEEDLKNFLVIMSQNHVGRSSGSKNQPGHSAGGTRAGAGRKAADGAPLGTLHLLAYKLLDQLVWTLISICVVHLI